MQPNVKVIFTVFILLAMGIIGLMIYYPKQPEVLPSTFSLTPSPSPVTSPTASAEPVVTSWTTYTNNDYNFTISIPDGWNQQEYKLPSGVFIVAFSPNALPCSTCTYVHEGYFSVKIFNQKTDQQAYTTFTTSLQNIGKVKGYQQAQLNNVKGVLYGNTVEVENHNLVYQVTLDANNGSMDVLSSQLFQKFASSLEFTYLIFSQ